MERVPLGEQYPIGYYRFHDNEAVNFQLNRFLPGNRLEDIRSAASRIRELRDWKREMLLIAKRAEADGRIRNAACAYRAAEFFMTPGDPDKDKAYQRFLALFEQLTRETKYERREVPFQHRSLPTLHLPLENAKGTLVMHGGFDSIQEDFFLAAVYFREAGYRVILFDGPGQGAALNRHSLSMIAEWELPVSALLDSYGIQSCSLIGLSLGGYLALRAAAFEPRIEHVVAWGVMYDFLECFTRAGGPLMGFALRLGLKVGASSPINRLAARRMKQDLLAAWGIPHGMHVMGTDKPYEMFRKISLFTTRSFSHHITQDVLLLAGEEDHYVPLRQFHEQKKLLVNARSLTSRVFTAGEHAQNHCQVGNVALATQTIVHWLDDLSSASG